MFVSVSEIRTYLNLIDDTSVSNLTLELYRNNAIKKIESKINRKLQSATYTEKVRGGVINLKAYPITGITSVSPTTTDYEFVSETGQIIFENCDEYEIVYVGGYSDETIPADIKLAILEITALTYFNDPKVQARLGVSSTTVNNQGSAMTTSYKDFDYKNLIEHYRNWNL